MKEGRKYQARNIILLVMVFFITVMIIKNEGYQDIKSLFSFALITASMKVVLDYCFGLTMRVGYSGDICNTGRMRWLRLLLLILGLLMGGVGIWFLMK